MQTLSGESQMHISKDKNNLESTHLNLTLQGVSFVTTKEIVCCGFLEARSAIL